MEAITKIKGVTRTVLELLREQIISNQLKAGQYLNETILSSQLSVSRPPLREALQILEQEQLVVSIPRKGRYVAKITKEKLLEIHQVRVMIESYTIDQLAKQNIREFPNVEIALKKALTMSLPSENPSERLKFIFAMEHFHTEIVKSVGNELLSHFYEIIKSNLSRYRYIYLFIPGMGRKFLQEHCQLLELLKGGNYSEGKDCLINHMNSSFQLIEEEVSGPGKTPI
jgi:DNA-binding GntR family transcriptional regulator